MNADHRHHHYFVLLPAGLFAWAGIIKIIDPFAMVPALGFVSKTLGLPVLPLSDAAIVIGAVELAMAAALLLFPRSVPVLLVGISLLAAYTAALVMFVVAKDAPSCGCLGAKLPGKFANIAGLIRNFGTIFLLAWLARSGRSATHEPPDAALLGRSFPRARMVAARGFTLVELMVVCLVTAILIAIVLPALGKSRAAAKDVRTLGTLRQLSIALDMYVDDHQDHFPFTAVPQKPWLGVDLPDLPYPVSYFGGQSATYANLLVPHYFQDRASIDTPGEYGARSRASGSFMSPYLLTYGAFAPNAYWTAGEKAPDGLSFYQSTTRASCLYPSNKAALIHFMSGMYLRSAAAPQTVLVSRMDGAGASTLLPAGYQGNLPDRPYGCQPIPFVATRDGLAGRDF